MTKLWTRRSVVIYFAVAFGVPWIGWTGLALSGVDESSALGTVLLYSGTFVSVAGLLATYAAAGSIGVRAFLARVIRVRVSAGWLLFATLPLWHRLLTLLAYGLGHDGIGRVELGGLAGLAAPAALVAVTLGPLGEELGWRGFLLPRLLRGYSPLGAAILLGVIWAVWHVPLYYDTTLSTPAGVAASLISLPCYSVLFLVLWAHTEASLFWAIVLHWMVNVSGPVAAAILPDAVPVGEDLTLLRGAVLVAVTAIVVLTTRARLARRLEVVLGELDAECLER